MATTLTVSTPYKLGGASEVRAYFNDNLRIIPFTFVPVAAYDTSGNAIAAADLPQGYKDLVSPWAIGAPGGYAFKLDVTNSTLWAYGANGTGTSVQLAANTNLQTVLGTAAITIFFWVR